MTQKIFRLLVIGFFFFKLYGCTGEREIERTNIYIEPESIDSLIIVSPPLNLDLPGRLYYDIGLLAVKKGLVITPTSVGLDTLSFYIDHDLTTCCPAKYPIINAGRGPGELQFIDANAKSRNGDSLMFFSISEAKFLTFDESMKLVLEERSPVPLNIDGNFAFSGRAISIAQSPALNDDHIFRKFNLETRSSESFLKARVPTGYQPQIRNNLSTMALIPDGIVFSYYGDQEILFLNKNTITRALGFGSNEPIDTWKSDPKKDGSRSKAYILKVEYSNDHLFVLYRKELLIFSYPELKPKKRIIVLSDINDKKPSVTGFSVYEDWLYITYLGQQISQIKMNPKWFD